MENIIENALRYVKTTIDIHPSEEEGLTISNDGPCMDEDRLKVLFRPYEMEKGGRFGPGLLTVARVVSTNGYKVAGENMAEGAIFRIYKPKNPVEKGRQKRSDTMCFSFHVQESRKMSMMVPKSLLN